MTIEEIRAEVSRLIDAGDESALEAFVLEHFTELPRDAQGALLTSYVSEAIAKRAADERLTDIQEQTLDLLESFPREEAQ